MSPPHPSARHGAGVPRPWGSRCRPGRLNPVGRARARGGGAELAEPPPTPPQHTRGRAGEAQPHTRVLCKAHRGVWVHAGAAAPAGGGTHTHTRGGGGGKDGGHAGIYARPRTRRTTHRTGHGARPHRQRHTRAYPRVPHAPGRTEPHGAVPSLTGSPAPARAAPWGRAPPPERARRQRGRSQEVGPPLPSAHEWARPAHCPL